MQTLISNIFLSCNYWPVHVKVCQIFATPGRTKMADVERTTGVKVKKQCVPPVALYFALRIRRKIIEQTLLRSGTFWHGC